MVMLEKFPTPTSFEQVDFSVAFVDTKMQGSYILHAL